VPPTDAHSLPLNGRAPECRTPYLKASIGAVEGAAGTIYTTIMMTNSGRSSCEVRGFPGVSFVDVRGRQVGAAADRDTAAGAGRLIVLRPGEHASSIVGRTQAHLQDGCDQPKQIVSATYLRIYPPANREALLLRYPVAACANPAVHQLTVTALRK
jgi:hypothetical protein